MRKKRGMRPLWQTAERLTGAEGEMLARIPVFVIRGMREVETSGCAGILEYGPERVVLALERGVCAVRGRGLTLEDFEEGTLFIRGEIDGINFDGDGEEGGE